MKKTIKENINYLMSNDLTLAQARSLTAQEILLSKIKESPYVDKVLLKGGVVMYNITQEKRRSTLDIDFDFLRVDISSNRSIDMFISSLNKVLPQFHISIYGVIQDLHQQDYKGKRVNLLISDESESIKFKIDIGVHTLLAINQNKMCFSFSREKEITLLVNPPEQIVAEKLFSLAKIGQVSQRFKDIDDIYYLITNREIDCEMVKDCLSLMTINQPYGIKDIDDVIQGVESCLNSSFFEDGYNENGAWLGIDYDLAKEAIINFLYKL